MVSDRARKNTIKIGVTSSSTSGLELTHVITKMAEEDINKYCIKSGLPFSFEFLISDNKSQPAVALKNTLIFKTMGINLVVGHGWSSHCQACLSYVFENDMLLISPSSTSPLLAIPNDNLFRLCPTDLVQIPAIAEMLWSWGIRACVVIQRGDAWADGIYNVFEKEYSARGGVILERIRYATEVTKFSRYLQKANDIIKRATAQYGLTHVGVEILSFSEAAKIVNQAKDYPALSSVKWFGSDGTALTPQLIDDAPYISEKLKIFSTLVAPPASLKFIELYDRYFSLTSQPLGYYSACMYDSCWIYAMSVILTGTTDAEQIKMVLPGVAENFYGVTGWCRLNINGDRYLANYDIWGYGRVNEQVQNVKYGYYDGTTGKIVWYMDLITKDINLAVDEVIIQQSLKNEELLMPKKEKMLEYDIFIAYYRKTAGDFAVFLKEGLLNEQILAFLDTYEIPKIVRKFTEEWRNHRDRALLHSKKFLLIMTSGFENRKEIIYEITLAKDNNIEMIFFKHKYLSYHIEIKLNGDVIDLSRYQLNEFDTKEELLRKTIMILQNH